MDLTNFTTEELTAFTQEQKDGCLIFAASQPNVEVIKKIALLIEAGANVNGAHHFDGFMPLIGAASSGHIVSMALLIQAGATLSMPNVNKETALFRAIMKEDSHKASLLFCMMSEADIAQEVAFNALRTSTFVKFFEDVMPVFNQLHKQKNIVLAEILAPLLPKHHHAQNPFSILPIELKRLIYFQYWAIIKKTLLQTYCSISDDREKCQAVYNQINPLVFSLDALKIKNPNEQQIESIPMQSEKQKKFKRKKESPIS